MHIDDARVQCNAILLLYWLTMSQRKVFEELKKTEESTDYFPSFEKLRKNWISRDIVMLHELAKDGNPKFIKEILEDTKVDINAQDNHGQTALHHAVIAKRLDIVKTLLEFKANVNIEDKKRLTPIIYAIKSNQTEVVKILLHHKATLGFSGWSKDIERDDLRKKYHCDKELIKILDEHADNEFLPTLVFMSHYRQTVENWLAERPHVNINHINKDGENALLTAVKMDREEIVVFLLRNGADISLKNAEGENAFDIAKKGKNETIIRLLKNILKKSAANEERIKNNITTPRL